YISVGASPLTSVAVLNPDRPEIRSLSERAYFLIRQLIVSLQLPPGSSIDERRLMTELGLGRTPIREALRRLATEDLVAVYPRRPVPSRSRRPPAHHRLRAGDPEGALRTMAERRSALYDVHRRLGAEMVKGGGDYLFPQSYQSPVTEHLNVRRNVGIQDLSSMGEIDVKGPGAERLLNQLLVNEVRDLSPGRLRYSTICNDAGGVVDDITVYKFHDEHFM